jgi:hypothetical protein
MKTTRNQQHSAVSNLSASRKLSLLLALVLIGTLAASMHVKSRVAAAAGANNNGGAFAAPIDPTATFLHAAMNDDPERSDNPATPAIIDLAAAGYAPGAEVKLSYQVLQPFSFNCNLPQPEPREPMLVAVFSASAVLLPPDAAARVPNAIKVGDEIRTGPAGMAEQSEPDDIAEDFQLMPVTGTTVRIPEGATHLFIGVVDSFYKDNCGQLLVTLERPQFFDICLQDNASGDTLLFNSFTGDYRFTRCGAGGFTHNDTGGRRAITRRGCTITLNDALVSAVVDVCHNRGSATVKNPNLIAVSFQIQDSYTKDNTCTCR